MANVVKQEMSLEDKRKALAQSGIIIGSILLLCYFFGWSYIYNTGISAAEVGVNGWNYIFACLSGNYKAQAGGVFGDISHPFNTWARYYVRVLAIMTTVSLGILLAYIVVSCLNIKKYHKKLETICIILLYVLAVNYLACIITALTMNGSSVLKKYCNSNPKCSIQTLAFFPFFITLTTAIVHSVFVYKNSEDYE